MMGAGWHGRWLGLVVGGLVVALPGPIGQQAGRCRWRRWWALLQRVCALQRSPTTWRAVALAGRRGALAMIPQLGYVALQRLCARGAASPPGLASSATGLVTLCSVNTVTHPVRRRAALPQAGSTAKQNLCRCWLTASVPRSNYRWHSPASRKPAASQRRPLVHPRGQAHRLAPGRQTGRQLAPCDAQLAQLLLGGPLHVPCQPRLLQRADEVVARVDLPPLQAVRCGSRGGAKGREEWEPCAGGPLGGRAPQAAAKLASPWEGSRQGSSSSAPYLPTTQRHGGCCASPRQTPAAPPASCFGCCPPCRLHKAQ